MILLKADYINPFIEASYSVLQQTAGIDAKLGKIYMKNSPLCSSPIAIIIGLTGDIKGQAVFSMNKNTAIDIASSMMGGMPITDFDDISKSAVSEMTNMIVGNASTLFYKKSLKVEITPPALLTGDNLEVYPGKMQTICIPLNLNKNNTMELDISIAN